MDQPTMQTPVSSSLPSYPSDAPKKSKNLLFAVLFFVILIILALGAKQFLFGSKEKKAEVPAITPTPTEYQFPTDTPAPSPTTAVTPTAKAVPTTNPVDQGTGLDRSTLTIEVQNGSGVAGVAVKAGDYLKGLGYKVSAMGNADNFDYANTVVRVKDSKSSFLSLLKKDLGFSYTVGTASADLSSTAATDALVIVGKQ